MRSVKSRVEDVKEDPKKLRMVFTLIWVVAYGMLILGGLVMIWVFLYA